MTLCLTTSIRPRLSPAPDFQIRRAAVRNTLPRNIASTAAQELQAAPRPRLQATGFLSTASLEQRSLQSFDRLVWFL
ncbi:unnamed protein product [Pleuronectes platessa]|uniref:Uncharacterized protein n=1 Tax=Pleuronectes platessa TaxID=8262 RepID=A0A9N7Y8N5_PLEPL|nr:unnamed protein product [Pleuronectes platessa]